MKRLIDFQQQAIPEIEAIMQRFIREQTNDPYLAESMLYSVEAGGKRIRPLLLAATVASFGKKADLGVYQVAAALEMIHTYSLIHDDLPAMDNDDLRRGKPTNHKVYGEAMAILAGDGLLTLAFQLVSAAELEDKKKLLLVQKLSEAAGTAGMVAGQAADIQGENQQLPLSDLMAVHARKTGELIRFAATAGGILSNQTDVVIEKLDQFASHVGLAFQIRDDLLDVVGTTKELGKTAQKDAQLEKSTYPSLLGVQKSQEALEIELKKAVELLEELTTYGHFEADLLREFVQQFE